MSTGRDLISRVRSLSKLENNDNLITDRAIFKELKSKGSLLIKRETNLRRLWNTPNIFTVIECIEMETVPLSECCDYKTSCDVTRSVQEIPQIGEGIFGLLIQYVMSPGLGKFDYASPDRFVNILKMGLKNTNRFYWFKNNRIYTSDANLVSLNIAPYFDDDVDIDKLSKCQKKKKGEECNVNPLDKPFKIPSYLEDNLVSMVHDVLSKTYFRHAEDQTPDNKDTAK